MRRFESARTCRTEDKTESPASMTSSAVHIRVSRERGKGSMTYQIPTPVGLKFSFGKVFSLLAIQYVERV
jgi:hypothetical protein